MSQQPPEPPGSHPDQPPQQDPTSSRPDGVGSPAVPTARDQQETPHQPYDQQVPDGCTPPDAGSDPYRQAPYDPGPQDQQGYPSPGYASGPQGYAGSPLQGYAGSPLQGFAQGPPEGWHQGQQGYAAPGQQGPGQQPYAPPGPTATPAPPLSARDETLWAVLAHLSIPFLGFVGPLVVYVVYRERNPWLRQSAVEALNFALVYTVAQVVCSLLVTMLVGAVLMPLVFLAGLVLCILAALAASRHEPYRYPVAVRLVR